MKIYTKKGDSGHTLLLGGRRVPKHHVRIEAYGSVDELNSFIGALRDQLEEQTLKDGLRDIQNVLFVLGSHLAADPTKKKLKLPKVENQWTNSLEESIDTMEEELPPLTSFILPGGHPAVSSSHICRSICRRAERNVSALSEIDKVNPFILQYLNRLSDFFFVLARYLAREMKAEEIPWTSK